MWQKQYCQSFSKGIRLHIYRYRGDVSFSYFIFIQNEIDLKDSEAVTVALEKIQIEFRYNKELQKAETYLNQQNVEQEIRKLYVAEKVSRVAALKSVRIALVKQQQEMGKAKGVVMDGRDIGSVVFPDAELKVFMTASTEVRALRRMAELEANGEEADLQEIKKNLKNRDRIDSTRAESPLIKVDDAIEIDTSHLQFNDQVKKILTLVTEKIGAYRRRNGSHHR